MMAWSVRAPVAESTQDGDNSRGEHRRTPCVNLVLERRFTRKACRNRRLARDVNLVSL